MTACLYNRPLIEYRNLITEFTAGESVADEHCRLVPHQDIEIRIDLRFCLRIQSRCGLIQYHKGRILIKRTGQRNFLQLSAGKINSL